MPRPRVPLPARAEPGILRLYNLAPEPQVRAAAAPAHSRHVRPQLRPVGTTQRAAGRVLRPNSTTLFVLAPYVKPVAAAGPLQRQELASLLGRRTGPAPLLVL